MLRIVDALTDESAERKGEINRGNGASETRIKNQKEKEEGFERGQALLSLGKVQSSGLFGGVRFVEVVNIFFTV